MPNARFTADVVFRPARVAVFMDGCFWHGCREHGRQVATNTGYWNTKITRNQQRDATVDNTLLDAGWIPVRVWGHEPIQQVANRIAILVKKRREANYS
jgi:DNA mismatch endonuclease (patch repair protein)